MNSSRIPTFEEKKALGAKADMLVNAFIKMAINLKNDPSNTSKLNNMLITFNELVSMKAPPEIKEAEFIKIKEVALKELVINPDFKAIQSTLITAHSNGNGVAAFLNKIPAFLDTLAKVEVQHTKNIAARGTSISSAKGDIKTITDAIIACRSDPSKLNIDKLSKTLVDASVEREQGVFTKLRSDISLGLQGLIKANPGDLDILNKAYASSDLLGKAPSFLAKEKGSMEELYAIDASYLPPAKSSTASLFSNKAQGFQKDPVAPKGEMTKAQQLARALDAPKTAPPPRATRDEKAERRKFSVDSREGDIKIDTGDADPPRNRGPGSRNQ